MPIRLGNGMAVFVTGRRERVSPPLFPQGRHSQHGDYRRRRRRGFPLFGRRTHRDTRCSRPSHGTTKRTFPSKPFFGNVPLLTHCPVRSYFDCGRPHAGPDRSRTIGNGGTLFEKWNIQLTVLCPEERNFSISKRIDRSTKSIWPRSMSVKIN